MRKKLVIVTNLKQSALQLNWQLPPPNCLWGISLNTPNVTSHVGANGSKVIATVLRVTLSSCHKCQTSKGSAAASVSINYLHRWLCKLYKLTEKKAANFSTWHWILWPPVNTQLRLFCSSTGITAPVCDCHVFLWWTFLCLQGRLLPGLLVLQVWSRCP